MTKKDFEMIAKALKNATPTEVEQEQGTTQDGWIKSVREMARELGRNYPKFDVQKFLLACGIE